MEGVHRQEGEQEEIAVDLEELFEVSMSFLILNSDDVHTSLTKEDLLSVLEVLDQL